MPAFVLVVGAYLIGVNLLTFLLFRADKRRAIAGEWRIPEGQLLLGALLGGIIGARAGQVILRHKTRKQPFGAQLNAIAVVQVLAVLIAVSLVSMPGLASGLGTTIRGLMPAPTSQPAPTAQPHVRVNRGLN